MVRGHGGGAMQEERKNGGNGGAVSGDPQFTTPGVGEQLDETTAAAGEQIPGPMEGGVEPRESETERAAPRPRRNSARCIAFSSASLGMCTGLPVLGWNPE